MVTLTRPQDSLGGDARQQHAHGVGPKGEGGLDDATGAGGAGGASMKQSSGVVDLGKHKLPQHSDNLRLNALVHPAVKHSACERRCRWQ